MELLYYRLCRVLLFISLLKVAHVNSAPLKNFAILCFNGSLLTEDKLKEFLFKDGLFEGDLKIPMETIVKYYNFSSIPGIEVEMLQESDPEDDGKDSDDGSGSGLDTVFGSGGGDQDAEPCIRDRRAGVAGKNKLWTNNEVRYRILSSVKPSSRENIRRAIDNYEVNTCLRFTKLTDASFFRGHWRVV